jgi:hypothetical protein
MPVDSVTGRFIPMEEDKDYKTYCGLRRKGKAHLLCERWREGYENFHADMGPRPDPKFVLGRVDFDAMYCKENCRWMTRQEASRLQAESKSKRKEAAP